MTLSAKQLSQSSQRRERLTEICKRLPEITYETVGDGHIAFRIRKKIFGYYMAAVAPNNEAITKAPMSINPCRRRSLATVCRGTTGCAERIVRSSLKCGSPEVRSSRQLFSVLDIPCMFAHRRGVSSACLIAITRPLRHMTVVTVLIDFKRGFGERR